MRLLYIVKRPLTARDADRYGVRRALELGHTVHLLDVSRPSHPMLPWSADSIWQHPDLQVTAIAQWNELGAHRHLLTDAQLIMMFNQSYGLSRATLPVLRAVARCGTPYMIQAPIFYGAVPSAGDGQGKWLSTFWWRLRHADLINSVIARLTPRWLGIPSARFVLYNSLSSQVPNNLIGADTTPIFAWTPDYDRVRHLIGIADEPSAVFIDQFLPYHPDAVATGTAGRIDPHQYYASLRGLFQRIETELGLKVCIAAHPRADYSIHPDAFGGRPMIVGQTAELIARSRLVISHTSTAVGMAMMLGKPILLAATHAHYTLAPIITEIYTQQTQSLNTPLHFIDDPASVDLSGVSTYNRDFQQDYIARFLRHPQATEAAPLWDTVFSAIQHHTGWA